jgi:hypothetical protein
MTEIAATIRSAKGGYVLGLRWPYGPSVIGLGEVVCRTWEEAMQKLRESFEPAIKEESR